MFLGILKYLLGSLLLFLSCPRSHALTPPALNAFSSRQLDKIQELTSRIFDSRTSLQTATSSSPAGLDSVFDEMKANSAKVADLLSRAFEHSYEEASQLTQSLIGAIDRLKNEGLSSRDLDAVVSSLKPLLERVNAVVADPLLLTPEDIVQLIGFVFIPSVIGLKVFMDSQNAPATPYPSGKYNAADAADYFRFQPLLLLVRSFQLFSQSSVFLIGILSDSLRKLLTDPKQEARRAEELTELLTRLGPSFIKAGQSLSIRTDLLRPAYYKALSKLQDKVPSFPTKLARAIIEEDLGVKVESLFASGIEPEAKTIAAASLGQVYRAKLMDGAEVAVKVQRPDILIRASLDMYVLFPFVHYEDK